MRLLCSMCRNHCVGIIHINNIQTWHCSSTAAIFTGPSLPPQGAGRLGSITSLGQQMSFAELSQTDDLDPHLRSFVFESSQTEDTGTEL